MFTRLEVSIRSFCLFLLAGVLVVHFFVNMTPGVACEQAYLNVLCQVNTLSLVLVYIPGLLFR